MNRLGDPRRDWRMRAFLLALPFGMISTLVGGDVACAYVPASDAASGGATQVSDGLDSRLRSRKASG